MRPASVVAGWTVANLVLASVMWIFHENPIFIGLYYIAALPLFGAAFLIWRASRARPQPPEHIELGQGVGFVLLLAAGCALIGLGVVYYLWISLIGLAIGLASLALIWRSSTTHRPGG